MTDRYRQALEGLRERCAQEAERITARRRAVAAMTNNEAVKPCAVAAAIRKIDVQQYHECAVREIERLEAATDLIRSLLTAVVDLHNGYPIRELHIDVGTLRRQAAALGVTLED